MKINHPKLWATLCSFMVSISTTQLYAECTPSLTPAAPDARYNLVEGGDGSEVLDLKTGLIWQRCSLGQTWNRTRCIGTAKEYTWGAALQSAKQLGNDYRLPNVKELLTLIEPRCRNPAVNRMFFEETPNYIFWSSTPSHTTGASAWIVDFRDGSSATSQKSSRFHIRLVRSPK